MVLVMTGTSPIAPTRPRWPPSSRRVGCRRLCAPALFLSVALALLPAIASASPGAQGAIAYSKVTAIEKQAETEAEPAVQSLRGGLFVHGPRIAQRPTRLTDDPGDTAPSVSPDGRTVVFGRVENAGSTTTIESHLFAVNIDGSDLRRLTSGGALDGQPSFSPDGREIVFTRRADDHSPPHLFLMPVAGGEPTQLTFGTGSEDEPVYAPSGHLIIFVGDRGPLGGPRQQNLFSIAPGGTGRRLLVAGPSQDREPAVSPDGRRILFVSGRDGGSNLFLASMSGTVLTQVTHGSGCAVACYASPTWSPDGGHIAFLDRTHEGTELEVARSDGTHRHVLDRGTVGSGTKSVFIGAPDWGA
jgi:Tol biopolymer transport system component